MPRNPPAVPAIPTKPLATGRAKPVQAHPEPRQLEEMNLWDVMMGGLMGGPEEEDPPPPTKATKRRGSRAS